MIQFQGNNQTNARRKGGQTIFPANIGVQTSTTAVDWLLKVKDVESACKKQLNS